MTKNDNKFFCKISFLLVTAMLFAAPIFNLSNRISDNDKVQHIDKYAAAIDSSVEDISIKMDESETRLDESEKKLIASHVQTGWITEQILEGNDGEIHYSYYLPEGYDGEHTYPMMVVIPGYDMMWFGEKSSGSNLSWRGLLAWTELEEDLIVVSAQLTDWHEKSARQAIELTEYFLENFAVDESSVYAVGYSAGGETMLQAVSLRSDLYAAYLHAASQWDGAYDSVAENGTAVYIFMAENDEYYGSQQARNAYENLHEAYAAAGWTDEQIDSVLRLEIPDNEYFSSRGIYGNYHGGGNILFEDESILNWIISHRK